MTFPDPRSPEFWAREETYLIDALDDVLIQMLGRAGVNGRSLLPTGLRVLVDWDVFSQAAVDFVRRFGVTTLRGINETTRGAVVDLIDGWIRSGDPIGKLQDQLARLPQFDDNRAKQIAVTEVTRVYAEGNIMAWRSTGLVDQKRWQTARDERVCPICAPLHNVVVSLDGGFTPSGEGLGPTGPPAHTNCLPGDSLVLPVGGVAAGSKRWYEGDVVIVETPKNKLAVTPNHPILTSAGWVPAGRVAHGDDVLCYNFGEREAIAMQINKEQPVSRIEDIFGSLGLVGFRVPVSAPDFHNDGAGSDVAVVRPNSRVVQDVEPHFAQPSSQNNFLRGDVIFETPFSRLGSLTQFSEWDIPTSRGLVSGGDLVGALLFGHSFPFRTLGFGLCSGHNAVFEESPSESPPIDAGLFSELVFGLTGNVTAEKVVQVRNDNFAGHVYNLQTETGLYVADGIITHNCRCWLQPIASLEGLDQQLDQILASA